jgi:hypothetical protein
MENPRREFLKTLIGGGAVAAVPAVVPEEAMAFGRLFQRPCPPPEPLRTGEGPGNFYVGFPYSATGRTLSILGGPNGNGKGKFFAWGVYKTPFSTPADRANELHLIAYNNPTSPPIAGSNNNLNPANPATDQTWWAFLIQDVPYDGVLFRLRFNNNDSWVTYTPCLMTSAS